MKLTKQIAEKILKSEDQELKDFALANFPELNVVIWEDLPEIKNGFYLSPNSDISTARNCSRIDSNKIVLRTKELAQAQLAQAQLEWLKWYANDCEELDGYDYVKYGILNVKCGFIVDNLFRCNTFLLFKTKPIAEKFLADHIELIEQYKPLM